MKATGIVRRIDDLGRVVVPKEIRRTMRIREGDPLEIYTNSEGEILLKKYSPVEELGTFASMYAETLAQTTGNIIFICDRDKIIAATGKMRKEVLSKPVSSQLERTMSERKNILASRGDKNFISIIREDIGFQTQAVQTIICEGDSIGAVVITSLENGVKFGETEKKLAQSAAVFLGKHMES